MLHGAEERSRLESQTVFNVMSLNVFVQFPLATVMTSVKESAFSLHIFFIAHRESRKCATCSVKYLNNQLNSQHQWKKSAV